MPESVKLIIFNNGTDPNLVSDRKKMMQIQKYPVASMKKDELLSRIDSVERWKDLFETTNGQIYIRNSDDIEQVIDLFTERFTRSDVTEQEYDMSVKYKCELPKGN